MVSDPAIFVIDLQEATKNKFKKRTFFCLLLFEGKFTPFSTNKRSKRGHKTVRIKVFVYYICLMIDGAGSGSTLLTNGSGSVRPRNM
jgi:hypothetical protein